LSKHGNLGYDAVYSMPVHYRMFYIRKLSKDTEKEKAAYDTAMGKKDGPSTMARGPGI